MHFKALDGNQRRQLIDTQQTYEAWLEARATAARRFAGGMRWGRRSGKDYLLRKIGTRETSLGRRSAETEAAFERFTLGRQENKDRLNNLATRLDSLARVNQAMALGRVPIIAARILRLLDERGLLGDQIFVVGTNALFAYEVLAGIHIESAVLTSADIDFLYDARRHLSLAYNEIRQSGLIGLLGKVDQSFRPLRPRGFRAANKDGYQVDLIRPERRDVLRDQLPAALTDLPDDLEGAAIFGLEWLINSPKLTAIAIDERGYPLRMVVIDPRAYALHKAWVADRPDREPLKASRDREQAKVAAYLSVHYLRLSFEDRDLEALPNALREKAQVLLAAAQADEQRSSKPDW